MKIATSISIIFSALSVVYACEHGQDHDHSRRSYAPSWVSPPAEPLVWGDINIIHTTDSHGWLQGHQKSTFPEPNYSGDFGDFAAFVSRMKQIAADKGVDLLLVDSGDLHDGSGLTEAYPPDSVDGHDANEIFALLPYDLLAIGNHELYNYSVALDVYENFVPKWKNGADNKYLTSNVYITPPGQTNSVPIGAQSRKFTTTEGRTVMSFSVLFNFTGAKGTSTTPVKTMVGEDWFLKAITDPTIDLFVIPGQNYTLNQSPYNPPDTSNLVQFWIQKALPYALSKTTTRTEPFQVIANNNSQRFDIYSGSFTKNDELSASFYPDHFYYVNIPFSTAQDVIKEIDTYNKPGSPYANPSLIEERYDADRTYRMWVAEMSRLNSSVPSGSQKTLGYVTTDHCLGLTDGDDTPHTPLPFFPVPQYVWSTPPTVDPTKNIDLVVLDYLWNVSKSISVKTIVEKQTGKPSNAQLYSTLLAHQATGIYAENCWKIDGKGGTGC